MVRMVGYVFLGVLVDRMISGGPQMKTGMLGWAMAVSGHALVILSMVNGVGNLDMSSMKNSMYNGSWSVLNNLGKRENTTF